MGNKKFRPKAISFFIIHIFSYLIILICMVWSLYYCVVSQRSIIEIIVLSVTILIYALVYIYHLIDVANRRFIFFDNACVYSPNSAKNEKRREQFEIKIFYNEIISVRIKATPNSSIDSSIITLGGYGSLVNKKYLEFLCKDEHKKRIWINSYSKKQVVQMLKIIKDKSNAAIDVGETMKRWYVTYYQMKKVKADE